MVNRYSTCLKFIVCWTYLIISNSLRQAGEHTNDSRYKESHGKQGLQTQVVTLRRQMRDFNSWNSRSKIVIECYKRIVYCFGQLNPRCYIKLYKIITGRESQPLQLIVLIMWGLAREYRLPLLIGDKTLGVVLVPILRKKGLFTTISHNQCCH